MSYEQNLAEARRHVRHGRYNEAIELFKELLKENDIDPVLHDAIGSAYFLAGKNVDAAKHFERIVRLTTNPGKALINLGAVYNRVGEYQKAVDSIRKGIQYEKKSVEGYYNLGVGHRKLGQYAMAVTAYKESLRLDPEFAECIRISRTSISIRVCQNKPRFTTAKCWNSNPIWNVLDEDSPMPNGLRLSPSRP